MYSSPGNILWRFRNFSAYEGIVFSASSFVCLFRFCFLNKFFLSLGIVGTLKEKWFVFLSLFWFEKVVVVLVCWG
jgi:hypothetical protein